LHVTNSLRPNSITLSSSLAGRKPASEPVRQLVRYLDSAMEFGKFRYAIQVADLVADLVSNLSQTGSSYIDM